MAAMNIVGITSRCGWLWYQKKCMQGLDTIWSVEHVMTLGDTHQHAAIICMFVLSWYQGTTVATSHFVVNVVLLFIQVYYVIVTLETQISLAKLEVVVKKMCADFRTVSNNRIEYINLIICISFHNVNNACKSICLLHNFSEFMWKLST